MNSDSLPNFESDAVNRRTFVQTSLAGAALASLPTLTSTLAFGEKKAATEKKPESEKLVEKLYGTLSEEQKKDVCFDWDHKDDRGLLRLHVSNNWHITKPTVTSAFFTKDQQELIEAIFFGLYDKEWHKNIKKQLQDDAGGYGKAQNIAIFGEPGKGNFEFVMTGRHLTIRCDGHSNKQFAFGGPIFYGHAAQGFNEKADHPGNVFWPQALEANKLYKMLDGKQQKTALVKRRPQREREVHFQGKEGTYQGIRVAELSKDQQAHVQLVLAKLVEPYRKSDQESVAKCLKAQGGLEACHLAFYESHDIGEDKVWDNWRLEGPSFVWYFRGSPHVHVWVNVANDPSAKITTRG